MTDATAAEKGTVRLRRARSAEAQAVEYRGALSWPPFGLARIFLASDSEEFLPIGPGSHTASSSAPWPPTATYALVSYTDGILSNVGRIGQFSEGAGGLPFHTA